MAKKKGKKKKPSRASQKTLCKLVREAKKDEKKGSAFYRRMAKRMSASAGKKAISGIAAQEQDHLKRLTEIGKDLIC